MDKIDDLTLLHLFYQCSHSLQSNGKYCGQGRLLILLSEEGPLTQRKLADITGRRAATLSEQLESMEKAGYITRSRSEQDKRNVNVVLTALGREAARDAQNNRTERAHRLFSMLNAREKAELYQLLEKLLPVWKELPSESEAIPK